MIDHPSTADVIANPMDDDDSDYKMLELYREAEQPDETRDEP